MSDLLERIATRYNDERVRIEVPEWGTDAEPFIAYSRFFTVADERRVLRQAKGDADDPETWGRVVFLKLEDSAGSQVFAGDDFQRFIRACPANVVKRIGMQIFAATTSVEDAEGNSPGTPL